MQTNEKILVITPHTDDELFGCGGTLLKILQERPKTKIKIAVMSCSARYLAHLNREVTEDEQWQEFVKCSEHISTEPPVKLSSQSRLEEEPVYRVIRWLDQLINDYRPTTIFIPEPSYHQEHQLVYRSSIAACRPTFGDKDIKNIYLYEIPTSTWNGAEGFYKPNIYVDISNHIEKKIDIFKDVYKVQYTSEKRNKLGEHGIRSHAKYRGIEAGQDYSETFMLLKSTATF